jgi:hypothetical protein
MSRETDALPHAARMETLRLVEGPVLFINHALEELDVP